MVKLKSKAQTGEADPIVTRLAAEDKVSWWRKPNLRYMYMLLFPTCMGIEITSGFDSQMINALQILDTWKLCTWKAPPPELSPFPPGARADPGVQSLVTSMAPSPAPATSPPSSRASLVPPTRWAPSSRSRSLVSSTTGSVGGGPSSWARSSW